MKILPFVFILLFLIPIALAVDMEEISEDDKETFNEILKPVMKIYNLVKYTVTVIACIMGVIAGSNYITSGGDPKRREGAKHMVMYIFIGLAIIWAAPMVVNFIIG